MPWVNGGSEMDPTFEEPKPLARFFGGMVEYVFHVELGVCDPRLTSYLGELLSSFVHVDQIYRLRGADGERIYEISRMEAEGRLGPEVEGSARTREVNRFIGDFTLFWTGVYPENVHRRRASRLQEYMLRGKRSYRIACELSDENGRPPADLLRRLSAEFECCAHGLNRVRQGWEDAGQQFLPPAA